ncbi:hypothetical protein AVEN_153691-1 [Araneus ventricosus]|uniref:Uncharacterized protein n=1 Tax=Araneus ventricosus TaxID=182803 RepID=A0A4Y2G4H3_ARAVE|nr:hypothetical protein AVEN_153691-1 [Araneus ventricosus]
MLNFIYLVFWVFPSYPIHITLNLKSVTPPSPCPLAPGVLKDSGRYNRSSTEAGVLVAHCQATVRSLLKEVRTITGGRVPEPPPLPYNRGSEFLLIYPTATHPCTRGIHINTQRQTDVFSLTDFYPKFHSALEIGCNISNTRFSLSSFPIG